jgi:KaiC/GvpD/RAD55 family RecA-like ATPase
MFLPTVASYVVGAMVLERLSTGVDGLDALIEGGIPRGFFVAVTGEPGCGKTILSIHFTAKGVEEGDRCVYVTTEESRNSILTQADMLGMDLKGAVEKRKLVIIDALMGLEDRWSLSSLDVEHLLEKVICSFSARFLRVCGVRDIYIYSPRQGRRLDIYYNNHTPQHI